MDKNLIKREVFNFLSKPLGFLLALLLLSAMAGLVITGGTNLLVNKKIAREKERKRPANLEIITIKDASCKECYDIGSMGDALKKQYGANIISDEVLESSSKEASELIKKFNIEKIPTVIIKGEFAKPEGLKDFLTQLGDFPEDNFVLRKVGAPYLNLKTKEIKGKVSLLEIKANSCSNCYDVKLHEQILKSYGVYLENIKVVEEFSGEAQQLISNYNISFLPTILLKGDVGDYLAVNNVWPQVGTIEKDGAYVFREGVKQMGAYKDLTTGQIITPKTN